MPIFKRLEPLRSLTSRPSRALPAQKRLYNGSLPRRQCKREQKRDNSVKWFGEVFVPSARGAVPIGWSLAFLMALVWKGVLSSLGVKPFVVVAVKQSMLSLTGGCQ